jgi:hypothetical protein
MQFDDMLTTIKLEDQTVVSGYCDRFENGEHYAGNWPLLFEAMKINGVWYHRLCDMDPSSQDCFTEDGWSKCDEEDSDQYEKMSKFRRP